MNPRLMDDAFDEGFKKGQLRAIRSILRHLFALLGEEASGVINEILQERDIDEEWYFEEVADDPH